MAQPPLFTDIDNLTDELVDSVNAKLQLQTLRDLCLSYNNLHAEDPIEIEEIRDDKIAMILVLWMRNIYTIHETITWGDPYDTGFKQALTEIISEDMDAYQYTLEQDFDRDEDEVYTYPKVRETVIYKVLTHPEQLLGFLRYQLRISQPNIRNLKLLTESLGLVGIDSDRKLILTLPKLSSIELAYIAIVGTYVTNMYIMGDNDRLPGITDYVQIYYPEEY